MDWLMQPAGCVRLEFLTQLAKEYGTWVHGVEPKQWAARRKDKDSPFPVLPSKKRPASRDNFCFFVSTLLICLDLSGVYVSFSWLPIY